MQSLGKHLILDIWTDIDHISLIDMKTSAEFFNKMLEDANVTVLNNNWHHFGEGFGYTGVIVLAESHMSIHTWPEHGYAAIDIFVCGSVNPKQFIEILQKYFGTNDKLCGSDALIMHRGELLDEI